MYNLMHSLQHILLLAHTIVTIIFKPICMKGKKHTVLDLNNSTSVGILFPTVYLCNKT